MTGFPWIDAIMRQLRSDGWIHDVARRAVGSFLTRGCLWINWEEGFKVKRLKIILLTVGNGLTHDFALAGRVLNVG